MKWRKAGTGASAWLGILFAASMRWAQSATTGSELTTGFTAKIDAELSIGSFDEASSVTESNRRPEGLDCLERGSSRGNRMSSFVGAACRRPARGFKSGGFNFTSREPGRGYDPEWAWSYEAGLKARAAGGRARLSFGASTPTTRICAEPDERGLHHGDIQLSAAGDRGPPRGAAARRRPADAQALARLSGTANLPTVYRSAGMVAAVRLRQ
jgi:hypothetical protein